MKKHIIWNSLIDIDDYKNDDEVKLEAYQEYVDNFKENEEDEKYLLDYNDWFETYVDTNNYMETIGIINIEDLEENILPEIEKQITDDIILIVGAYNSNYAEFRASGNGSVYLNGIDNLKNYMSEFDMVCINSINGKLSITLSDHDGTIEGTLYTIPAGKEKLELLKNLNYEDKVREFYDEEDIKKYKMEDLIEEQYQEDLYYGGIDEEDFGKVIDKLVAIKDTISIYGE